MFRSFAFAAVLLASPLAAIAQDQLPPASTAPGAPTPPASDGRGYGGRAMTPEMRQAREAIMQACSADFARFCGDVQPGGGGRGAGGGRMQCIRAHASELSDGCRGAMQSMRAARAGGGAGAPASPQG